MVVTDEDMVMEPQRGQPGSADNPITARFIEIMWVIALRVPELIVFSLDNCLKPHNKRVV